MRVRLVKKARKALVAIPSLALIMVVLMGADSDCGGEGKSDQQRDSSVSKRTSTFDRASQRFPLPNTTNFPLRGALVKMTERQDLVNHPWYVYILGDNGNVIGYYVGQTVPVNACDFLSSTEDVRDDDDGNLVLQAPSLDGIYYGGSGAASGCDAWFFFDYATDALIQIRGTHFYSADQPLLLNAEPITVQTTP